MKSIVPGPEHSEGLERDLLQAPADQPGEPRHAAPQHLVGVRLEGDEFAGRPLLRVAADRLRGQERREARADLEDSAGAPRADQAVEHLGVDGSEQGVVEVELGRVRTGFAPQGLILVAPAGEVACKLQLRKDVKIDPDEFGGMIEVGNSQRPRVRDRLIEVDRCHVVATPLPHVEEALVSHYVRGNGSGYGARDPAFDAVSFRSYRRARRQPLEERSRHEPTSLRSSGRLQRLL